MVMSADKITVVKISTEKSSFAACALPSPNFLATMALPPVESISVTANTTLITGYTILIDASAFSLTN